MTQYVWTLAELGLEEQRPATRLIKPLRASGFEVKEGVSGMPTAFEASYGSCELGIGILAEYDVGAGPVVGRGGGNVG
jgi:aminobenzoyl-glutamate utilization protein B